MLPSHQHHLDNLKHFSTTATAAGKHDVAHAIDAHVVDAGAAAATHDSGDLNAKAKATAKLLRSAAAILDHVDDTWPGEMIDVGLATSRSLGQGIVDAS